MAAPNLPKFVEFDLLPTIRAIADWRFPPLNC